MNDRQYICALVGLLILTVPAALLSVVVFRRRLKQPMQVPFAKTVKEDRGFEVKLSAGNEPAIEKKENDHG